jgi:mannose-1-phosphate guanylyltransferase/mannose-6-phosphate isomerase
MKIIVLAGGSGTRLWPLSRTNYPKQFIKINGLESSLFQMTIKRCLKMTDLESIYVVTNEVYKFHVQGQFEEMGLHLPDRQILKEPQAKNTLPAILYGLKEIQKEGDHTVTVFPSDHLIKDEDELIRVFKQAESLTSEYIITFGIKPAKPHTGYGYIKPDDKELALGSRVKEFKEKPDLALAQKYINQGYLWNSGMFMFNSKLFINEVKLCNKSVYNAFQRNNIIEMFEEMPSISIDYGVLEKSSQVAVVPLDIPWSDMGSFDTFFEDFPLDDNSNVVFNNNILIDTHNSLIYSDKGKTVALVGMKDVIVVDEKDALLICKKDRSEQVKEVVQRLKDSGDSRSDYHLTTYRPWGSYTVLEEGFFYKIKKITVLPGKKLSYQLHHHRSEHWIVVKGTALVIIDGVKNFVRSGESTYVKSGLKHRLENPGKVLLEVIEVQFGEYLEEDDITRFDDEYGRCGEEQK